VRSELGGTGAGPGGVEQAEIVHESVPLLGVRHNDTRPVQRAGIESTNLRFWIVHTGIAKKYGSVLAMKMHVEEQAFTVAFGNQSGCAIAQCRQRRVVC